MKLFDQQPKSTDFVFTQLRDNPELARQRGFIEDLYSQFEPYGDRNFAVEFAKHCLSRCWEIFLGCTLLQSGFPLIPRTSLPAGGPDICVKKGSSRLWIEAVVPQIGTGDDSAPLVNAIQSGVAQLFPENEIVLRFCSAIRDKFQRHEEHIRKGLAKQSEPFLIAVNGAALGDLPTFPDDVPYAIQAVLPFGPYSITFDPITKKTLGQGFQYKAEIPKKSGSTVPTNIFLDLNYALISGLIFSNINPFNYKRVGFHEMSLLNNYLPTNPLERGLFPSIREFIIAKGDTVSVRQV
jgi:hypothetical protein